MTTLLEQNEVPKKLIWASPFLNLDYGDFLKIFNWLIELIFQVVILWQKSVAAENVLFTIPD